MNEYFCCPNCGGRNLQATTETKTQTTGKNYSGTQGCLGFLLMGPLGLLCGLCGQGQKTVSTNTDFWVCPDCGDKFESFDSLRRKAKVSRTISNSIVIVMGILGIIMGFSLYLPLSEYDGFLALCMLIFVEGIMIGAGFLGKKVNGRAADEIERRITEQQEQMKKFCEVSKAEATKTYKTSDTEYYEIDNIGNVMDVEHKDFAFGKQNKAGCIVETDKITSSETIVSSEKGVCRENPRIECYLKPVKILKHGTGLANCPICGTEQSDDREFCVDCKTPFINRQADIPYWCNECGKPGPYGNFCPNCGSNKKIIND